MDAQFQAAREEAQAIQGLTNEEKLDLYGLYKQGTEGAPTTPQPWAIKVEERAKWDAWNKLGDMSKEEAQQKYINKVAELKQIHS